MYRKCSRMVLSRLTMLVRSMFHLALGGLVLLLALANLSFPRVSLTHIALSLEIARGRVKRLLMLHRLIDAR